MRRLLAAFILLASWALGMDFSALKPQGYVSDFAGVVDARAKTILEKYCAAVEQSTGAQMAFVTVPTLAGEPLEEVANVLAGNWGIGRQETDEGVLLLLVINDRRSRLEVGYGLEPVIPDGYGGSLLREMRPALRAGAYSEAMTVAAQTLGRRIAEQKGVAIQPVPGRRRPGPEESGIPWVVVAGGLVLLVWLMSVRGGRRVRLGTEGFFTGMLLGNLLGRRMHGHGRSNGGFGGYDSFDSFGGFGGGDFGGGGASSDW